jgi:ankyrin repeat protein
MSGGQPGGGQAAAAERVRLAGGAQNMAWQLMESCELGNFAGVRQFVSSGASVDFEDELGYTPSIRCCMDGHADILQYLIEHGADSGLADSNGFTPLHAAAVNNNPKCVTVLLRDGVELNAITNSLGYTAIWWASRCGYLSIVKLLDEGGADMDRYLLTYLLTYLRTHVHTYSPTHLLSSPGAEPQTMARRHLISPNREVTQPCLSTSRPLSASGGGLGLG